MSTAADRVSAGIALLDEKVPNWRDKVNIATLNIRHTRQCVLGQVFKTDDDSWESGYDVGIKALGLRGCKCCDDGPLVAADYGFDANMEVGDEPIDVQFDALQEEWERQLSLVSA